MIERHLRPTFGALALAAITSTEIAAWNAALRERVPTTAAKSYRLLSTILRAAVDDEILARNPCRVKGAATETASERSTASVAEVAALADAMPADLRCAVLVAAWCSLRRGEVLGLRRCDVDPMHGTLTVAQTRIRLKGGRVIEKAPKTDAGRRSVAIPPVIADELVEHLAAHVERDPTALVFPKGYKPLRTAWDNAAALARREADVPRPPPLGADLGGGDGGHDGGAHAPWRAPKRRGSDALPARDG